MGPLSELWWCSRSRGAGDRAWAQVARQWVAGGAGRANSRADDPGAAQIARREVAGGRWRRRRERRAVRLVSVPMTVRP